MDKYSKIDTVYKRDPNTKFKTLLEGEYSKPEFEYLENTVWSFTEKIDGTNTRVLWDRATVRFAGKTDDSSIPTFLLRQLEELFHESTMHRVFVEAESVCLYGEGYGKKIQKRGELYLPDSCSFILFDVKIGETWLERDNVGGIAHQLQIDVVPIIGLGTLKEGIELVRRGFGSHVGRNNMAAEGIVMRPQVELQDRLGNRIITKIKHKDFDGGPRQHVSPGSHRKE